MRARFGFNVFRYCVSDQQIIAVGGGANTATLLNADKTSGQGFELDAQAYLTDNLLVTLGSSYNDTEIDDPGLAVPGCGGGCTVTDPETAPGSGLYVRSEEHTSELQSLMRISYAVFCLKKKKPQE